MDAGVRLPIQPADGSLTSHLLALDALAGQLANLTLRTRWPAHIPLNSKASFRAELVHTNDVRVCVGGEWWVEMTAAEAVGWVHRRKRWLLEERARLTENGRRLYSAASNDRAAEPSSAPVHLPPTLQFNPLFPMPAGAAQPDASSASQAVQAPATAKEAADPSAASGTHTRASTSRSKVDKGKRPASDIAVSEASVNEEGLPIHEIRETPDGTSLVPLPGPPPSQGTAQAIAADDKVDQEDRPSDYWSPDAAARREALRKRLFSLGDDTDDDEQLDDMIGTDVPQSSTAANTAPIDSQTEPAIPSAVPVEPRIVQTQKTDMATLSRSKNPTPLEAQVPSRSMSTSPPSPSTGHSSSVATASQPKSILKAPSRKKSVSFDTSVPLPPESPERPSVHSGFPMPSRAGGASSSSNFMSGSDEFAQRPVPVITEPKPALKKVSGERGFAGFKPGFLNATKAPPQIADVPSPIDGSPERSPILPTRAESPVDTPAAGGGKKPSLFAQRMLAGSFSANRSNGASGSVEHLEEASPPPRPASSPAKQVLTADGPNGATGSKGRNGESSGSTADSSKPLPAFPKMSSAKETIGVKGAVVEREPAPIPRPFESRSTTSKHEQGVYEGSDEDVLDEDEDEDEDEEEGDDDEYDIDQALLAREIALDYHRRHAYASLRQDPSDTGQEEEEIPDMIEDEGGVMLGIPKIAMMDEDGRPMIVNPTPDDIRQYVRVGKLENGNLVLAPGEKGWSDDEDEELDHDNDNDGGEKDGVRERKRRAEAVKKQLLGREVGLRLVNGNGGGHSLGNPGSSGTRPGASVRAPTVEATARKQAEVELPPTVVSVKDIQETERKGSSGVGVGVGVGDPEQVQEAQRPKKVSRFKAARMGGS